MLSVVDSAFRQGPVRSTGPCRLVVLMVLAVLSGCGESVESASGTPPAVDSAFPPGVGTLRHTVLTEPPTAPLGAYTTFIAVSTEGRVFVADMTGRLVVAFSAQGSESRAIGKSGEGPGEFRLPGQLLLVDSGRTLAVNDVARGRFVLFDARTGKYLREVKVPVSQLGLGSIASDGTVLFAQRLGQQPFVRWDVARDSIAGFGAAEPLEAGAVPVQMSLGIPGVVQVDSLLLGWRPAESGVSVFSLRGDRIGRFAVPRSRRRGEPEDFVSAQRAAWQVRRDSLVGSLTAGVHRMSDGRILLVSIDQDGTIGPNRKVRYSNFRYFVSVLSADLKSACVDARVPFTTDAVTIPAFVNDELVMLGRTVTDANAVVSSVERFSIRTDQCKWFPVGKIVPLH